VKADAPAELKAPARPRSRLLGKYVLAFVGLVGVVLTASTALDAWLTYQQAKEAAVRLQAEKAAAAAQRIEGFIAEIERQIGWTTHAQWAAGTVEQRRFDYIRLLRQVPAITELVQLDGAGREQLKVSRLAMDVIGSGLDHAEEPRFKEALAQKVWFSPVYFRKESEPYVTMAVARTGRGAGVTVAEVNLKLIWDVITTIKVGEAGFAYVVDRQGRLIAHPDISLVLRNTDLSPLPQVAAAIRGAPLQDPRSAFATDRSGREVLSAVAPIPRLGWFVFVELPVREALAPLYATLTQTLGLLAGALALSGFAGLILARRMVGPIRQLEAGAERLGRGDLGHRIEVRTGDELERLADRFNAMSGQLQESYAGLERKVEERTRELQESLEYQTATSNVLAVISRSPNELRPVLQAIVETATGLCEGFDATLLLREGDQLRVGAHHGSLPLDFERKGVNRGWITGRCVLDREAVHVVDFAAEKEEFPEGYELFRRWGHRTGLAIPLMSKGQAIGAFMIRRPEVCPFSAKQIAVLQTFADQAVIAINNVRLFEEVQARTRELAQSVAELRTLGEVSQAVNSTLDLNTVLTTIVAKAVQLSGTDTGAIYVYSRVRGEFRLRATYGMSDELVTAIRGQRIRLGESAIGQAAERREPLQIPDLRERPTFPVQDLVLEAGHLALLVVPLVAPDRVVGALVVRRREAGAFPLPTVELMKTFAAQSVLAIQNARLFSEIEEKGRQLEIASQHKSQFLANMSHELRTPLNAVLGYAELLADGLYGDLPERAKGVLARIQSNGQHLLALINDVLDLSKIEAGQLTLSIDAYAVPSIVQSVITVAEPLAAAKGLTLEVTVGSGLPLGQGDERRLTQVLLNLVGNAVKFTDQGSVRLAAGLTGDRFEVTVADTGPGIAAEHQAKVFEAFQQIDNSSTRKRGGTGLGLAISKQIIELHGGSIELTSELGVGSTFRLTWPVQAEPVREAAE
jgi:signal transduction histidine kinase